LRNIKYTQKDFLSFILTFITGFLIIPILIHRYAGEKNSIWILIYYLDAIVLTLLFYSKLTPWVINKNYKKIENDKTNLKPIKYLPSEPTDRFSKYFYKYHELINYDQAIERPILKSIFEMGKFGYLHLSLIGGKLFLYTLFVWLFIKYYEPSPLFFFTILGVATLELLTAIISLIDFWRKIYANGKDSAILEERVSKIERVLFEKESKK
jgi:hypothetical protein